MPSSVGGIILDVDGRVLQTLHASTGCYAKSDQCPRGWGLFLPSQGGSCRVIWGVVLPETYYRKTGMWSGSRRGEEGHRCWEMLHPTPLARWSLPCTSYVFTFKSGIRQNLPNIWYWKEALKSLLLQRCFFGRGCLVPYISAWTMTRRNFQPITCGSFCWNINFATRLRQNLWTSSRPEVGEWVFPSGPCTSLNEWVIPGERGRPSSWHHVMNRFKFNIEAQW